MDRENRPISLRIERVRYLKLNFLVELMILAKVFGLALPIS